ncbi:MAG: hypothetical protein GY862_02785 [Gammaproteobacteria bacterium]|nr:hypothetical protein [Gammaproteobacteria bacterium]
MFATLTSTVLTAACYASAADYIEFYGAHEASAFQLAGWLKLYRASPV